jgi:hypothetical protein
MLEQYTDLLYLPAAREEAAEPAVDLARSVSLA